MLEELRGDFPEVSVSKIRFLEAQGLIHPGRTASGYRQFSEADVALLRWILVQQREHYLPLKVIKRRLREGDGPGAGAPAGGPGGAEAAPPGRSEGPAPAPVVPAVAPGDPAVDPADSAAWYLDEDGPAGRVDGDVPVAAVGGPARSPAGVGAGSGADRVDAADALWPPIGTRRSWSRAEVAREAGVSEAALAELESFGLIRGDDLDDDAVAVARAAAAFAGYGVEARHLRMYKTFADREAALFEQAVMPMANSRQEEQRARAAEALAELARLGQRLRLAMLRAALGPPPGG